MDDLGSILRDRAKPELNYLYTERPFGTLGGLDFGWSCREHAYHTYFLCRMLGADARIILGDTSLHTADGREVLSTFDDDSDHAWTSVEGIRPVDLSFTLEYLELSLPAVDIIYGAGTRGGYFVAYEEGAIGCRPSMPAGLHHIRYSEQAVVSAAPESLLSDPFVFLKPAKRSGLATQFGHDIFDKITYHLYRIAVGEIGPYSDYVKPWQSAMQRIRNKNPGASRRVRELLAQTGVA